MQKELQRVRISAVDMFVDSTLRYGLRLSDIDNRS
jgi:hypothetical protein